MDTFNKERDLLTDFNINHIMNILNYVLEENILLKELVDKNNIKTNSIHPNKKHRLSGFARKLNAHTRKKHVKIASIRTVVHGWFDRKIAGLYDSSNSQPEKRKPGKPRISKKLRELIIEIALDNPQLGYQKISNKVKLLEYPCCASTVRNVLNSEGIYPAPERKRNRNWRKYSKQAGTYSTDFFTKHIMERNHNGTYSIACYYILFYINNVSRKVTLGGITKHPDSFFMRNQAVNFPWSCEDAKVLIHDGDKKFTHEFKQILSEEDVKAKQISIGAPNMNSFAERWVRTVKEEALDHLFIVGYDNLCAALNEYIKYYNHARPHQSLNGMPPEPYKRYTCGNRGKVRKDPILGGLIHAYFRDAV